MSTSNKTLLWPETRFQRLLSIGCMFFIFAYLLRSKSEDFGVQRFLTSLNHHSATGTTAPSGPPISPSVVSDNITRSISPALTPPAKKQQKPKLPQEQEQQKQEPKHEKQGKHSRLSPKDISARGKPQNMDETKRIKEIRQLCGEICREKKPVDTAKGGFAKVTKAVNCRNLFKMDLMDSSIANTKRSPPKEIPPNLRQFFSYGGKVQLAKYYLNNAFGGDHEDVWTKESVESYIQKAKQGIFGGSYGQWPGQTMVKALDSTIPTFPGMHALVIGSLSPWIEAALLLNKNISHVTTVEYMKRKSKHPQISAMTPFDMAKAFLEDAKQIKKYNLVVSFSSLEHSGLGRFGDALNPWGDLASLARAWCLTEKGGYGMIGVPRFTSDAVCFNAHRIYGPVMIPQLFANWEVVHKYDEFNMTNANKNHQNKGENCYPYFYFQPIFIIKKI